MHAADRTYAMNIAAIRAAAGRTQVEVAQRLGVGQSVVSRTEHSDDMLLSTLGNYLAATGAESARIVVRVHGVDVELELFSSAIEGASTEDGPL
ncbi:helix-turn-helix domain-containing protein [Flexivirga caeni]|uniref:Helix-turn-helix domain-containing protein n=2 Tax=Flexivirga caeni TaxID=2294115 RepID=A0A3M9M3T2_9MICO|nr:helix-turn-helix domain-containing protein [Flexivirga caeni]